MQGVPLFPDSLWATGVKKKSLFDYGLVSSSSLRKMAGNSFSQPCMTAFLTFVFSHLIRNRYEESAQQEIIKQHFYNEVSLDGSTDSDSEDDNVVATEEDKNK